MMLLGAEPNFYEGMMKSEAFSFAVVSCIRRSISESLYPEDCDSELQRNVIEGNSSRATRKVWLVHMQRLVIILFLCC